MDKLTEARNIINEVDKSMAELFIKRMDAAKMVAAYKREHGLPILDQKREDELIEKNCGYINDDALKSFYITFLRDLMKTSRNYQHMLVSGAKIAYSGVEGAFANIAARRTFPDGQIIGCENFKAAYDSVVNGECECVVLPVENSHSGEVGQVMDLIFSGPLKVCEMVEIEINQNLLGVPGATLGDIKEAISHPQALSQCGEYLKNHSITTKEAVNTAIAAKDVAEKGDITTAAIASEETAKLYGLEVLERKINEDSGNTTRFAVLTPSGITPPASEAHTMLLFTVKNEAGSLAKAINIISGHGYNMTALRSRPMKDLMWKYYFYIEIEGIIKDNMLDKLANCCDKLKVAGVYKTISAKKVAK